MTTDKPEMTDKQREALESISSRYNTEFKEEYFLMNPFDLPKGWCSGWVGGPAEKLYIGCDPEGRISS